MAGIWITKQKRKNYLQLQTESAVRFATGDNEQEDVYYGADEFLWDL